MDAASRGYVSSARLPQPPWRPPPVQAFEVPLSATGMGPACPFAFASDRSDGRLPLVFETTQPLFSADECSMVVGEAARHFAAGRAGSGFTFDETSRSAAVADLPRTLDFVNTIALPRVAATASACFGEAAVGDPRRLHLYRAIVVHYDAAAGLTHQMTHRDHSLITCVVTLNDRREYEGGGTWVEALGHSLTPPRGHAMLQASALRHGGHTIESGQRWVMVLFMLAEELRYGEVRVPRRPASFHSAPRRPQPWGVGSTPTASTPTVRGRCLAVTCDPCP